MPFRRNINIRTIAANMRRAPKDTPTPTPALAPVESPLLDEFVSWDVEVGVAVGPRIPVLVVICDARIPVLVVICDALVAVAVTRSEARQRIDTPLALIPSAVVVKLETIPP